jgi:four helix bundle protein
MEHAVAGVKRYEDLVAWQRAMSMVKPVYQSTQRLPAEERFGLISHMRRAAISIPSNIAEGFGRESTSDMVRFLRMARGSLFELRTQYRAAVDLGFLDAADVPSDGMDECDRVVQGLIRSLERPMTTGSQAR